MLSTPQANRLAIAFFGRRNVGKSSLVNALTGQEVSLISSVAGSTADPVTKSMELWPIGPITVIDTAGLDDEGELGSQKIRRAKTVLSRADLSVLVCEAGQTDRTLELNWLKAMAGEGARILVVENKIDQLENSEAEGPPWLEMDLPLVRISSVTGAGLDRFRDALAALATQSRPEPSLVAGLFPRHSLFLLVAPQDVQAPKGRLILPQVQVMRDILDHGGLVTLATFDCLEAQIGALATRPAAVIVDAQVFTQVTKRVPADWPVTAFSIIMARSKGDLPRLFEGAEHIDRLKPGDRILVSEACTHHALKNDIGREQIPALLQARVGGKLKFDIVAGNDFPEDPSPYALVISCGGCMITRGHFQARLRKTLAAGVPMTNYGLTLAHLNGHLARAVAIFKDRDGWR